MSSHRTPGFSRLYGHSIAGDFVRSTTSILQPTVVAINSDRQLSHPSPLSMTSGLGEHVSDSDLFIKHNPDDTHWMYANAAPASSPVTSLGTRRMPTVG